MVIYLGAADIGFCFVSVIFDYMGCYDNEEQSINANAHSFWAVVTM